MFKTRRSLSLVCFLATIFLLFANGERDLRDCLIDHNNFYDFVENEIVILESSNLKNPSFNLKINIPSFNSFAFTIEITKRFFKIKLIKYIYFNPLLQIITYLNNPPPRF